MAKAHGKAKSELEHVGAGPNKHDTEANPRKETWLVREAHTWFDALLRERTRSPASSASSTGISRASASMPVIIGTSGWHYAHWRPRFYPARMGPARWLTFYADRFAAVEVNSAFYRLPERATFEHWADSVPADFVMAVKASRYLTHVRRLQDPAEPVGRLMDRVAGLGPHLGPILLQLPPTLPADPERLDAALAAFGDAARLAVEPRHASWFVDDVRRVLERRKAALCLADGGPVETPPWRTTDWAYVRFHGGTGRPRTCYKRRELEAWTDRLTAQWTAAEDVYCFFNNDTNGCALRDARWLADWCSGAGREVTRVPGRQETHVGALPGSRHGTPPRG